jgi:hypothetical protein
MSAQPAPAKKTVYVDVDEEITGIIDKVQTTGETIVALVLPKRATVLQSIVNMKLLKRAADQADKKIVLITSESTLMPLAGAAGIHVAANLQSRPYLPSPPDPKKLNAAPPPETEVPFDNEPIDPNTPIGDLAPASNANDVEPIEIDNTPKAPAAAGTAGAAGKAGKKAKPPKDKNKKVPNFNKFRVLLFAGLAAVLLIGFGSYWALAVAPKATVTLRTESSETMANASFTADTGQAQADIKSQTIPAHKEEVKKTESEKVPATGTKDNGTKAGGNISLRNCTDNKITIPEGTGISNGDITFITQSTAQLDSTIVKKNGVTQCQSDSQNVSVVAQQNGEKYNLSPRTYIVSGFSSVLAQGDQMNGGTSKIVKVVSAADADAAKKRISDKQNAVVDELKKDLSTNGYRGIVDTFSTGTPAYSTSPAVGTEANEVIVSGDVTYSMLGVKEADLKLIVNDQVKDKVDTTKQSVLNYGFDEATFEVGAKKAATTQLKVKTTLVAGPDINQADLKNLLAGKKGTDAENLMKSRPGITDAKVALKPFWVKKIPSKESKVTFIIEQANGKPVTTP